MRTLPDSETAFDRWAVDELVDRYVSWSEERHGVGQAYQRWANSGTDDRGLAYAGYLAALDREEHAARSYADQADSVLRICVRRPRRRCLINGV